MTTDVAGHGLESSRVSVPAHHARIFEPSGLGPHFPRFVRLLGRIASKPQSVIVQTLDKERERFSTDESVESLKYRFTLAVFRDYVTFGYYPLVTDGRCYLVPLAESKGMDPQRRRILARRLFQSARNRALEQRNQIPWLQTMTALVSDSSYNAEPVLQALQDGPPEVRMTEARSNDRGLDSRGLWRAVRATWSMGVETSAPGREVAFLVSTACQPETPLGILQFRNVVPEIVARDRWLGISAAFGEDGSPLGYLRLLGRDQATASDRLTATRSILHSLLKCVNPVGIEAEFSAGDPHQLAQVALARREAFNHHRKSTSTNPREQLHVVKRAETAADLIRGIGAIDSAMRQSDVLGSLHDGDLLRDLNAGLRKIWHYHMGFVALEMSICGAAPPFGPIRVGKLIASLAGSEDVIRAWGDDRPLGEIAANTYLPEVRDAVPNPGPIAVFTSGLYEGHSAQYNRVQVGPRRWTKIGETVGYGSFHVSHETSQLASALNEAVDGYRHITRSFGEGSGARFRVVGRAMSRLELPDLLKHEIRRPLYVLPLVDDVQGTLLGWKPPRRAAGVPLPALASNWWHRWVESQAERLALSAGRSPDLSKELTKILQACGAPSDQSTVQPHSGPRPDVASHGPGTVQA